MPCQLEGDSRQSTMVQRVLHYTKPTPKLREVSYGTRSLTALLVLSMVLTMTPYTSGTTKADLWESFQGLCLTVLVF